MARTPAFGLILATLGALVLTPDAMLMRLSGMEGVQMLGVRSTLMGLVLLGAWAISRMGHWRTDAALVFTGGGIAIALCQGVNGAFFTFGIVGSPVTIVLLAVATVPVFAALFSWALMGEATGRATWITIAFVLGGIAIAIFGKPDINAPWDAAALRGGLYGLGVAICLSLSLVLIRRYEAIPILPSVGLGALGAGITGIAFSGPSLLMGEVTLWPILLTGALVLPLSFFCLSLASRHTAAANVSLLLLLETVLGPMWVWLAIGEGPSMQMLLGGAIVISSLSTYLLWSRR